LWLIYYRTNSCASFNRSSKWWDINEAIPSTWSEYTLDTYKYSYVSGVLHQILEGSSGISGSGKLASSMMLIKLYRTDNVYGGDVGAITFDIHAEIDKIGAKDND